MLHCLGELSKNLTHFGPKSLQRKTLIRTTNLKGMSLELGNMSLKVLKSTEIPIYGSSIRETKSTSEITNGSPILNPSGSSSGSYA